MDIPIYRRESGKESVKLHAIVDATHETATHLSFLSQGYLSVDLDSHYYYKRKSPTELLELVLIEFSAATEMQPPYTYTAKKIGKYRDVAEDWSEDE
jgi:hypothetical protein